MKYAFSVPDDKKIDVIIDTDAKNEADDQYAIAHALLSPKLNVLGIVAAHFGKRRSNKSMLESYEECLKIVSLMDVNNPVYKGNIDNLETENTCEMSEGVKFIIDQANKTSGIVNIAVLGPLTNVAAALIHDPTIKDKIKVWWIGGCKESSEVCYEANARNDYLAVNVAVKLCENFVQIPAETYSLLQVSIAELKDKVSGCGEIGEYLFSQLNDFNMIVNRPWLQGESWCFGDTAAISMMINNYCGIIKKRKGFVLNSELQVLENDKEIDIVTTIDSRYALEDFFSKIRMFSRNNK